MMRLLRAAVITFVALVAIALVALWIVGLPPHNQRPGLWLPGTVVTAPVGNWSFTDAIPEIQIQTRTWYLLPHSVTTQCASMNGQLYVASFYYGGPRRAWNRDVMRDPRIRLSIGGQLYDRQVVPLSDPAETAQVFQAYAKKYAAWKRIGDMPEAKRPTIFYWRVAPA